MAVPAAAREVVDDGERRRIRITIYPSQQWLRPTCSHSSAFHTLDPMRAARAPYCRTAAPSCKGLLGTVKSPASQIRSFPLELLLAVCPLGTPVSGRKVSVRFRGNAGSPAIWCHLRSLWQILLVLLPLFECLAGWKWNYKIRVHLITWIVRDK